MLVGHKAVGPEQEQVVAFFKILERDRMLDYAKIYHALPNFGRIG